MRKAILLVLLGVAAGMVVKSQSLIFYYPFNDNLTDNSGNNHVLTDPTANSYTFNTGKYGMALELNGTDQYLDLLTESLLEPSTTSFTVCAWVYNAYSGASPTGEEQAEQQILHQLNGSSDTKGRVVLQHLIKENNLTVGTWIGGAQYLGSDNVLSAGQWVHVALVGNPSAQEHIFYIDGQESSRLNTVNPFELCTGGFRIGAHKAGDKSFWEGRIDDLCLYSGMLSQAQLLSTMNGSISTSSGDLLFENDGITISPNPSNGNVMIEMDNYHPGGSYTVYNALGAEISSGVLSAINQIDLSGESPGVYVIIINHGDELHLKKVILK